MAMEATHVGEGRYGGQLSFWATPLLATLQLTSLPALEVAPGESLGKLRSLPPMLLHLVLNTASLVNQSIVWSLSIGNACSV